MNRSEVITFLPDIKEIQESPLVIDGREVAFQVSVISKEGIPLGSGFDQNRDTAQKKAISEAIERRLVENLLASEKQAEMLLNEYPTSCGFAVGLTLQETKERALAEAVERWLRSKWIDDGYLIMEFPLDVSELNPIEKYFAQQFKLVRLFVHSCSVFFEEREYNINSVITVGLTDKGAFVGSKSAANHKASLLASLVESWRHKALSQETRVYMPEMDIVKYFSTHRQEALDQIDKAVKRSIPIPKIRLAKEIPLPIQGVFAYRVLCEDFKGWHGPDITRFVY